METLRWVLFIWFVSSLAVHYNVEGRYHYHKKQRNRGPSPSPVSPPPSPPEPSPVSPSNPPSVPSDASPDPNDPGKSDSPCTFDVTDFGAVGDGDTDDTAAFRAAWKAACAVEYAVLLAPADKTFVITSTIFSGPCKPGLVFQVDGILMPPDGPECWPETDSKNQWLVFYRLDGMTLTGKGTIEGNGEKWWELPCKPHRVI